MAPPQPSGGNRDPEAEQREQREQAEHSDTRARNQSKEDYRERKRSVAQQQSAAASTGRRRAAAPDRP